MQADFDSFMVVIKADSKPLPIPYETDSALLLIHFQTKFVGYKAGYTFHYSFPCALASDVNDEVISVANKAQIAPFKLLVEFIQHDVG